MGLIVEHSSLLQSSFYPLMLLQAPEADYLDAAVVSVLQIHLTQPPGDVLVSNNTVATLYNVGCDYSSFFCTYCMYRCSLLAKKRLRLLMRC